MRPILPAFVLFLISPSCHNRHATPPAPFSNDSVGNMCTTDTMIDTIDIDNATNNNPVIIDSRMTFEEAIAGTMAPVDIIDQLVLLDVEYYSDDDLLHRGQLVVNKSIENDIREMFQLIKEIRFPVHQAVPIVAYDWDDNQSMLANNTSAFCYRKVAQSQRWSRHATGHAIDINPFFNPIVWKNEYKGRPNVPAGAIYDVDRPGTFHLTHPVVQEFRKRKFTWGYYFPVYYDYHHFHQK